MFVTRTCFRDGLQPMNKGSEKLAAWQNEFGKVSSLAAWQNEIGKASSMAVRLIKMVKLAT